ncbi:MAG: hypothetical protein AAFR28_06310 [Pseudomonadota bacterium]
MSSDSLEIVPLEAAHFEQMGKLNDIHALSDKHEDFEMLVSAGGWACLEVGKPIGAGGIVPLSEWRGHGWVLFTRRWWKNARLITSVVRNSLQTSPLDRVETVVKADQSAAHRWARTLGMRLECPRMDAWADGEPYSLYAYTKSNRWRP